MEIFYRQIIAQRRLPFQLVANPTIDELLVEAIWKSNPERADVDIDDNVNILVDKDKTPCLYDWAVNG